MIEVEIKFPHKINIDRRDLNFEKLEIDPKILKKLKRKINRKKNR